MHFKRVYPWQLITKHQKINLTTKLGEDYEVDKLRAEVDSIITKFELKMPSSLFYNKGLSMVCLVGVKGDYTMGHHVEGGRYSKTEALEKGGYLESIIDSFDCPKHLTRLIKLEPKKNIFWHVDYKSIDWGVVRVHIPIYTNPHIYFQISHEDCTWKPGELWYGDFSFPHRLYNASEESRTHLVMDLETNDKIKQMFPDFILAQQAHRQKVRKLCWETMRVYNLFALRFRDKSTWYR